MYRVLIADDEQWIRKWITKMIIELRDDFEIIASVDNGAQVLEILASQPVDIIISDIMMPELTGLELVEEIRKNGWGPQIIFVSGHDDFEFAQKALRLGAVEYLLKPIEREELARAFDLAVERIISNKQTKKQNEFPYTRIYYALERYLNDKLEIDNIERLMMIQELLVEPFEYYFGICQINIAYHKEEFSIKDVESYLNSKFIGYHTYILQREYASYYIMIISYIGNLNRGISSDQIIRVVKSYVKDCDVYFCPRHTHMKELVCDLKQIECELLGESNDYSTKEKRAIERQLHAIRSNLLLAITTGNLHEVVGLMRQLSYMNRNNQGTNQDFKEFFFICISELVKKLRSGGSEEGSRLSKKGYQFIANTQKYNDVEVLIDWMEEYLCQVTKCIGTVHYYNVDEVVAEVLQYLLSNYHEDVNLTAICDTYNINVSYFSKKFKESTGMNFVDLLTSIRLDAARQLLENSNKPIHVISKEVGFRDAKYFSKVFQNKVGSRPSEYRETYTEIKN